MKLEKKNINGKTISKWWYKTDQGSPTASIDREQGRQTSL